jgi:Methyltransferase domain
MGFTSCRRVTIANTLVHRRRECAIGIMPTAVSLPKAPPTATPPIDDRSTTTPDRRWIRLVTMTPMGAPAYDAIGLNYADVRRTDPRIAGVVWSALGDAASVVNVGAGTGSYEPRDRAVVAVEPSAVMIAQRPRGSAPAVRAAAEALPLGAEAVDAALAVLTVQHWRDIERGIERAIAGRAPACGVGDDGR